MARYVWQCDACKKTVEITRKMADYKDPPTKEELDCCPDRDPQRRPSETSHVINGYSYNNSHR